MNRDEFIAFLIRAKQHTYASGGKTVESSRPVSHDLQYDEGEFSYIDTYLGGFYFIGEEAVWHQGKPTWGMNYYGKMLTADIPTGFSEFLKSALMQVPLNAPYRGPAEFRSDRYSYLCRVTGEH